MIALLRQFLFSLISLWLVAGSAIPASHAGGTPLVIAITGTAVPFSHKNAHGELVGFNVDVAQDICRRLRRECVFETHKFPEILPMVADGRADIGVGNYLKTPEREQQVLFSQPYWRSTSSFIGSRTLKLPPLEAIPQQHRLCITRDSKQYAFALSLAKNQTDAIIATATNQQAFDNLIAKQCALVLMPTMQGLNFLQSPAGNGFAFLGAPLAHDGLGGDVHLIVRPDGKTLQQQIDGALRDMIADGTHERLSRKYFPFGIL